MLRVVMTVDAKTFPQSVKELIAMDLEARWHGRVRVVSVEQTDDYEQMQIQKPQP